ncbi:hypothetical protein HRbin17_00252 [bacterium HR17]|jgi:hypothetical protein|uniref:Uncharacterized protein n=1 Tax=Candidatus Fervidibacter japonicus TaxID=2035412 RepID=A0A2H5X9A7_9BACT|nr:hypothetical protein HRbin17_00252 [bacterium HR17]
MHRDGKALVMGLAGFVVVAVIVGLLVAIRNSPSAVAQAFAAQLARRDESGLRALVTAKDQQRVPRLIAFANLFPDLQLQVNRIENRNGQTVAVLVASFSQVALGAMRFSVPAGKLELPFALRRERVLFWRVDLEQSEPLLRQTLQQAALAVLRQQPALLQQLLQHLPSVAPRP